jgi:hypothetical protein
MQSFSAKQQQRGIAARRRASEGSRNEKEDEEGAQNDIVPQAARESMKFYQASVAVRGGSSGFGR